MDEHVPPQALPELYCDMAGKPHLPRPPHFHLPLPEIGASLVEPYG